MSSYLSTILTHTTSKYATLRRTLTSSEADGDTDDDSHISRVLRAYYTEKHLPLPPWLPPDPKRSGAVSGGFTSSLRQGNNLAGGAAAGGAGGIGGVGAGGQGQRGTSGLADLWNEPRGASPAPSTMLLRRQGVERGASFRGVVDAAMAAQSSQSQVHSQSQLSQSGSVRGGGGAAGAAGLGGARPLPSQRAGSYQSVVSQQQQQQQQQGQQGQQQGYSDTAGMSVGGGTAQERLKARLWGRAGSSTSLRADGGGQPSPDPYAARDRYGGR